MNAAAIKEKAKESVLKEARDASPLTVIKIARTQYLAGRDNEERGDLKGALAAFIKSVSLAKMAIDSPENERGGSLRKEINEFFEEHANDLSTRVQTVEEKLKSFERSQPPDITEPISQSGGTIADRLKALQDNGLSVGTPKRFSRNPSEMSPPSSPKQFTARLSSPSTILSTLSPSAPASSAPSPHTVVPPSSFGPSSPSSTPSSSPQLNTYNLSEFTQAFPSIEELDESTAFSLPSVPNGVISGSVTKDMHNGESSTSPAAPFRNFTVPIERPSSTPITPISSNTFSSRPGSPAKPTIPLKPSGLSTSIPLKSPNGKPILPISNAVSPKELANYISFYKVLLLDVRNRSDFEREHIKTGAVACIEPSVLYRKELSVERLEESMSIAPKHEQGIFANRDKFDLIVVYDEASTSYGPKDSPLSVLVRLIGEQAIQKMLKRMPMLLVGGMEAWRRDIGEAEIIRTGGVLSPEPQKSYFTEHSPSLNSLPLSTSPRSKNPFLNGTVSVSSSSMSNSPNDPHQVWTPGPRSDSNSEYRNQFSLDQIPSHSRTPAETSYPANIPAQTLARKPALSRPVSYSVSYTRSIDSVASPGLPSQPPTNGSTPITYPQFPRRISPSTSGSGSSLPPPFAQYDITSPPQASINPSQKSRRQHDYVDPAQETYSGFHPRAPIDYPELSSPQVLRPPPVAASSALERQDSRPRLQHAHSAFSPTAPKVPRIPSDYPVTYWFDTQIGTSGLKNLGNTCYMNAPIQCLSATVPFARFFTEGRWRNAINYSNALGSKGLLAGAFAKLLHDMWGGDLPYLSPTDFRRTICQLKTQYHGNDQHDSQEFLSFLLDGIHEDLNRIMVKPTWSPTPEQEAELERLPPQIASDQEWKAWRERNDSLIVDYFQGQFRNRLQCLTCDTTSTTYNVFSILQVPIPQGKNGKVTLQSCLEAFFNTEILEKDDAWDCPKCKIKRRATKRLSLARLPPVLLIHLKRFEVNGRFSDKIDTFVDFPMKSLDLTGFIPTSLSPGPQTNHGLPVSPEDPRTQNPPFRYDLYGVTNHFGNLSSGHYTASIASRGGWLYCDDSSVKSMDPKQVVSQKAYVLFYKRTKA
ncbi:hypothetical protein BDZ94DRAFT_1188229 [Collybia nuda]|uniref:ubiquitinyl hydrolase 1 n=1 Tax=Collybia nuda TaxID=64659 RepID=A0A9P6CLB4_9AGAR|nr:hypothetical protein BDZ94DRAFT_1188229 [Collybia nuda]